MTSFDVIENKISSIKKYLNILERYKKYSKKELEENVDIRGAVERYLYLAVQSAIELAESVVAFKNIRKPSTLSESFYILEEEKIISKELLGKMIKMTGFRNVIAHDYERMNYDIVYDVLQKGVTDISQFITEISGALGIDI